MKAVIVVLISLVCLPLLAEEKTCALNGLHCAGCLGTVKEKICNSEYSVCEVEFTNRKAGRAELHVITKLDTEKVDRESLSDALKDTTYKVSGCRSGAPKAAVKAGSKPGQGKKSS